MVAGPVRLLLVLWMYFVSLERNQVNVVLPQHGLECVVLDFVQERFQDMNPGDFESAFIEWDEERA